MEDIVTKNKSKSKTGTTTSYPGVVSRINNKPAPKGLLKLDVCINDSSDYSLYYFNIITKPSILKLGGNIFEFAPPRNRFAINSEILFEVVDANGNPLAYELLPKKEGNISVRICIHVDGDTPIGPAAISLVGEAIIDECGCPLPEDCQDKPNVRWSSVLQLTNDDISGTIVYDSAPSINVSETLIPWQYQTFEDVYSINPGTPGSPYTVSGSYVPTYNSQPTGSDNGKFYYDKLQEPTPDTQSGWPPTYTGGSGKLSVYTGNLRFSSSMVGGHIYVSGGINHISNPIPYPNPNRHRAPAFYATISAVLSATEAEVVPAYIIKAINPGGDIVDYPARSFDAKNGGQLTWTETSSSIAYTDPTADTTTTTSVEKTVEQQTSYIDLTITNLRPLCGIATDVEVYIRSNRTSGPMTKLTEFPIEGTNANLDDSRQTEKGSTKEFVDFGIFDGLEKVGTYWQTGGNNLGYTPTTVIDNSILMDSVKISGTGNTLSDRAEYITFSQKDQYKKNLQANTSYFVEFDAHGDAAAANNGPSEIDIYISGSGIDPTDKMNPKETVLGKRIGTIRSSGITVGEKFVGNSFEFKNKVTTEAKPIFVLRVGSWNLANIKVNSGKGDPSQTGFTPNTMRTLIPMPAITRHNDQYTIEARYKNKNGIANQISTFENAQFQGNDPSVYLAGQPNSTILNPWFHGAGVVTASKNVQITGSLSVYGRIFASEFHTTFVTTSIMFQEGDTIHGNSIDDTHKFVGNITASNTSSFGKVRFTGPHPTLGPGDASVASFGGTGESGVAVTFSPTNATEKITTWRDWDGENIFRASGRVSSNTLLIALGDTDDAGTGNVVKVSDSQTVFKTGNVGIGTSKVDGTDMTVSTKLQIQGNVSASGQLSVGKLGSYNGHITASGNISSSGTGSFEYINVANSGSFYNIVATADAGGGGNITALGRFKGGGLEVEPTAGGNGGNIITLGGHSYAGVDATAQGAVSASGLIYLSASQNPSQTTYGVLVRDPATGRVYHTGSYGKGAGSGGESANDSTITLTAGDGIKTGGTFTTNQAGDSTIVFDLDLNELTAATVDVAADSVAIIDANDSNTSRKESIRDIIAGVAGTGLLANAGTLSVDAENDKTNAQRFIPFLDNQTGANKLNTSPNFTYNPGTGILKVGMSVYTHVSGSVTASKNIWVSGSTTQGNFISGSNIISSHHITASGNIKATSGSFSKGIRIVHPDNSAGRGFTIANEGAYNLKIRRGDGVEVVNLHSDNGSEFLKVNGNILGNSVWLPVNSTTYGIRALSTFPGGITVGNGQTTSSIVLSNNVTASGDISASGTITAKSLTLAGGHNDHITFAPAVTISNASEQSPIAMNLPPRGDGSMLMWQREGDTAPFGKMVVGTIRQVPKTPSENADDSDTQITTVILDKPYQVAGDTLIGKSKVSGKRGSLEVGQAAFVGSPGIFISSGSISFFTSSVTSSIGAFNTASATVRMFNLKGDDGTSFVMSGSKAASIYFSGSTSGRVGIGTTDPQAQFEVAADEHVFRRRSELIGMKINAEGNIESFNKDAAFAATGSELVLSYTAGGSTVVTAQAINLAFPGLIAADTSDADAVTFFNTLASKKDVQAKILQACEKLGLFDGADVGDTLGSVRWLMRSGSEGSLNDRTSGEAGSIKMTVASSAPAGVTGKLSINLAADAGGAGQQLYSINGSTQKHEWTGSGGFHFAGATTQTGAATIKGHLTGKNTGQGQSNISGFDSLQIYGNATLGNNGNESHTFAGNLTGSTTAGGGSISVRNISSTGRSVLGNGSGDTHTFTGNITASGNISSSGTIFAKSLEVKHMSSSFVTSSTSILVQNITSSGDSLFGNEISDSHKFNGHITASGNISSSGDIHADSIIASSNIKSDTLQIGDSTPTTPSYQLHIRDAASVNAVLESTANGNATLELKNSQTPDWYIRNKFSRQGLEFGAAHRVLHLGDDGTTTLSGSLNVMGEVGQITASGTISSSATITANALNIKGGAGTEDFFLIRSGSFDAIKTNSEGVTVLGAFTFTPTARAGGFYYSNTDDEFYLGKSN
tara:strand:+ start:216 stop:6371 length:6156 start_codon:yes stop_codon:yes gene_type:complete